MYRFDYNISCGKCEEGEICYNDILNRKREIINMQDALGNTALHYAALCETQSAIKRLLKYIFSYSFLFIVF